MSGSGVVVKQSAKKSSKRNKTEKPRFIPGKDIPVYVLLLPAVILIFIFHYIPIYGIVMAFQKFSPYRGILHSQWVWFDNFKYFISDYNFWQVMKNTVIINIYTLIFGFTAPIIFALMLNEVTRSFYKRLVQTISYLPYFLSWVVVAGLITTILSPSSGIFNLMLNNIFGIEPIPFMTKQAYFRGIVVVSGIWKGIGMSAVYYLAALSGIDPKLYEAAIMDGANRWRQTWHITLPGIMPITIVLLILQVGHMVSIGFEQIFLLYNPVVYDVGDVISTYTYRLGLEQQQYSLTTAIGLTQSVVNFILVVSTNKLARRLAGFSLW